MCFLYTIILDHYVPGHLGNNIHKPLFTMWEGNLLTSFVKLTPRYFADLRVCLPISLEFHARNYQTTFSESYLNFSRSRPIL